MSSSLRHIHAAETRSLQARRRVMVALALSGGPLRVNEVAMCSSMTKRRASQILRALVVEGRVTRTGEFGAWRYGSIGSVPEITQLLEQSSWK